MSVFSAIMALTVSVTTASGVLNTSASAAPLLAPELSPMTSPGAVIESNRQPTLPTETKPRDTSIDWSEPETPPATVDPNTPRFELKSVVLEGSTILSKAQVDSVTQSRIGQSVTLQDLLSMCEALTRQYHSTGYITSRVYLPPQDVANGAVVLKAVEGKVGQIRATKADGNPRWGYGERAITPRVAISEGEPLNINDLRRSLLLFGESPDLGLKVLLSPGKDMTETDIAFSIAPQRPYHVRLSFDNLGRDNIGTERLGLNVAHNNFLGLGDSLTLGGGLSKSSQSMNAGYSLPVGRHGTVIGGQSAYSWLKLRGPLEAANIQGKASIYSAFIRQPLYTRDKLRVTADLGLDFKQLDTDFSKADLFRDQLRVLHTGLTVDQFDRTGRTILRNELAMGLDIFGATTGNSVFSTGATSSRAGGAGSQFFRWTPSVTRLQRMPHGVLGLFRLQGQYSPNSLVTSEQIQAGGAYTVRGYREGVLLGDSGIIGSAEFRFPLFFLPKDKPMPFNSGMSWRDAIQMVAFTDFSWTFVNRPSPGVDANDILLGAGIGLRATISKYLTTRVDLGFPLLTQTNHNNSPRIHFGLESQLF